MILPCSDADIPEMFAVINDSAIAYKDRIPADVWHEPYMSLDELQGEIADGIRFHKSVDADGRIEGVMGIQDVGDVTLIRHAYVRTALRGKGIGGKLLEHLLPLTSKPVLIGTWRDATWAIAFYEKHGFVLVDGAEKDRLLGRYWKISRRQTETSIVLRQGRA
jgi:GNAT superfamily N-acetyltransferase